jgi:hypothetical protein
MSTGVQVNWTNLLGDHETLQNCCSKNTVYNITYHTLNTVCDKKDYEVAT